MLFLARLEREGQGSRARILHLLREKPGMNLTQLAKAAGLSWTTVKYHLRRLQVQGVVQVERFGRRDSRWFPLGVPSKYRPWLATLLDQDTLRILDVLADREAGVAELARLLGRSESAIRRRLYRMHRAGMLAKRGKLRPRYLRNSQPPESTQGEEPEPRAP